MEISILGQNIKKIREQKGLSAYKLSKLAHVGTATIYEVENGTSQTLKATTLTKIANALQVEVNSLLQLEADVEYVVNDIEQLIDIFLSSDELTLNGQELSQEELDFLKFSFKKKIEELKAIRTVLKSNNHYQNGLNDLNKLIEKL